MANTHATEPFFLASHWLPREVATMLMGTKKLDNDRDLFFLDASVPVRPVPSLVDFRL